VNAAVDQLRALYGDRDNVTQLRVPPQAIEAEQNVLGALMAVNDKLDDVADWLAVEDFYRRDHQLIFAAILELREKGKPYDSVTLGEWFESKGQGEIVGGAYLIELQGLVWTAANIVAYAELVTEKARLRKLIEIGTQAVSDAFQPDGRETAQIIEEAQTRFTELAPRQRGGLVRAADSLGHWYEDLTRRYESGDRMTGLVTPWQEVNEATHGLQPGELTLVAARPSMGKSIFGLNLALFAACRGKRVALFSLEMSRTQCNRRNIASLGRVPHDWLLAPQKGEDEYWGRVTEALRQIKQAPLYVDDTPSLSIQQLITRAKRLHRREPIDLLVVDHIHDFKINAKEARFEYGAIAQGIKTLAKEWNIPAVALAQLNRNVTGRADKRPTLSDLRESGELEQKGDLILFLHREDYYDTPESKTHLQGVVELHIAKGRDIEAGKRIHLRNEYGQMRLADWEGPLPRAPESPVTKQQRSRADRWAAVPGADA
jgi:replicative DNA helicase